MEMLIMFQERKANCKSQIITRLIHEQTGLQGAFWEPGPWTLLFLPPQDVRKELIADLYKNSQVGFKRILKKNAPETTGSKTLSFCQYI